MGPGRLSSKENPRFSAVHSTLRASPISTETFPEEWAAISCKIGRTRTSLSITSKRSTPSINRPRVNPPGPGPTSTKEAPARALARRAIFLVILRSSKKFWPRDFFARSSCSCKISFRAGKSSKDINSPIASICRINTHFSSHLKSCYKTIRSSLTSPCDLKSCAMIWRRTDKG